MAIDPEHDDILPFVNQLLRAFATSRQMEQDFWEEQEYERFMEQQEHEERMAQEARNKYYIVPHTYTGAG